jgi:hypothetical protein
VLFKESMRANVFPAGQHAFEQSTAQAKGGLDARQETEGEGLWPLTWVNREPKLSAYVRTFRKTRTSRWTYQNDQ